MNESPWLLLDLADEFKWWIASNNHYTPAFEEELEKPIAAYFIIQDSNMMGTTYFRYFYWYDGNSHRHFNVDQKWYFDAAISSMQTGDMVTNMETQQKYIVNNKFNNKFVKILELVK
jgi:hypothetical protein